MKPHVHAELIKAWADGAEIQSHIPGNGWITNPSPLWREDTEYRIKPEEKKPVVRWLWAWHNLQLWKITDFYTEDELTQQGYDVSGMICLEFTRTEFPK